MLNLLARTFFAAAFDRFSESLADDRGLVILCSRQYSTSAWYTDYRRDFRSGFPGGFIPNRIRTGCHSLNLNLTDYSAGA